MAEGVQPTFLLRGVAGSQAHGLATEFSDEDLHGVFGWPTEEHYGLSAPADAIVGHEPQDHTYHEVSKFLNLALKNNPTVLELLWLDEYLEQDAWGKTLVYNRELFLHDKGVRGAFGGYAKDQFRKATQGNPAAQRGKNIRHCFRLMEEGLSLLTTGDMRIEVSDRQWYFDLQEMDREKWEPMFIEKLAQLDEATSVLPASGDRQFANDFLVEYRRSH